jgi:Transposase, Mutator family
VEGSLIVNANQKTAMMKIVAEGLSDEGADESVVPGPEEIAAERLADLVSPEAVDRMLADAEQAGMPVDGAHGLLNQLTRTVLERALGAELDDHLGYVKGDPAGNGSGNSRNGSFDKTVTTAAGPVRIGVPRDRNGSFEPRIVPKGQRRLGQVDDMILSLYARGMTTRDIQAHLAEVYGAAVSPALISNVTGVVAEEITAWQTRPLDAVYPIVYIDALVVKVRDGGTAGRGADVMILGNGQDVADLPVMQFLAQSRIGAVDFIARPATQAAGTPAARAAPIISATSAGLVANPTSSGIPAPARRAASPAHERGRYSRRSISACPPRPA